jgi:hypothetical protein
MTWPLYDSGFWSALTLGLLFGWVLEGAGFGSPRKLTAQFTLRDFAVIKVMFTAVIVAAAGLWLAESLGLIGANAVYTPTLFFWSIALGGALIGAGFAMGGYCPGTSAVGLASGRIDAFVFMAGMVAGIGIFAGIFDWIGPFYGAGQGPQGQTLDQLLGIPAIAIILAMAAMAAAAFYFGSKLEVRFGGPVGVEDDNVAHRAEKHAGPAERSAKSSLHRGAA